MSAGEHKASLKRRARKHNKHTTEITQAAFFPLIGHEDTKVLHKLSKLHHQDGRTYLNWFKPLTIRILCLTLVQEMTSVKKKHILVKENIGIFLI